MSEEILLEKYQRTGNRKSRDAIIESNLGLVRRIARYFSGKTRLPYEDLESEGFLGLMIAMERFDREKAARTGTRFSSYAYWWIRRYILRAVIHHGLLVSVPENVSELHYKYRQCFNRLAAISGKEPETGEVIETLAVSPKQARNIIKREDLREFSLEAPFRGEDDARGMVENITDGREKNPALKLQMDDQVEKCLALLEEREKKIIRLRFGLGDGYPMTYREIADSLRGNGVCMSRQRVHQVAERALEKIRQERPKESRNHDHGEIDENSQPGR